jgi:Recombination directionality factor-like
VDNIAAIIPPPKPQRGMAIRGLIPRLPERGKIKIGGLGDERTSQAGTKYRLPVKYQHFVVTTMERDRHSGNFVRDEAMHNRLGEAPTTIPVRLLYDDPTLNFPTRYACYEGRTLWCSGDGRTAQRVGERGHHLEVACTCPLADPAIKRAPTEKRCKMNGLLSVLLEGASGLGGVWKFRTTSYNSIVELLSTMSFIRQITGGPLANIPLLLTVRGRQAVNPVDGSAVQIYVVGLEFAGDVEQLQQIGHQIALNRATTHLSIEHIEEEARRTLMLAGPSNTPLPGDDDKVVDEFYPEQAAAERMAGEAKQPRPTRQNFQAPSEPEKKTSDEDDTTEAGDLPPHVMVREEEGPDDDGQDEPEADAEDPAGEPEPEPEERNPFWSQASYAIKAATLANGRATDWKAMSETLKYLIADAQTADEVRKLQSDNRRTIDGLKLAYVGLHQEVINAISERIRVLGIVDAAGRRLTAADMG